MKRYKLATILISLSSSCLADTSPDVQLNGVIDFQMGSRYQPDLLQTQQNITKYNTNAFISSVGVFFKVKKDISEDYRAGAKVVLKTTAQTRGSVGLNGTHIFIESDRLGRVELGSPFDAGKVLNISGDMVSRGSGSWNKYANLNPNGIYGLEFKGYDFYSSSFRAKDGSEPARKISYYTPVYHGIQFGISYMPDSTNLGDSPMGDPSKTVTRKEMDAGGQKYVYKVAARNMLSGGLTVSFDLSEEANVKLSVVGRAGQSIHEDDKGVPLTDKLGNLKEFNIGGVIARGNFSLAGSYSNLGDSFLTEYRAKSGTTKYYSAGLGYQQGPLGASITYLRTDHLGNKLNAVGLATNYMLAAGLTPYAELTLFKGAGKGFAVDSIEQTVQGAVAILGMTMKF